ncbi:MAG: SufS family cysteine desulfurase [Proteobacteria bacterium]|nr:SufS family cysteine desulfurase [Pseudomonadota bacterium]
MAYLDTAASTLKPRVVIDRLSRYLATEHANIHRGAYRLSAHATDMYEQARGRVAKFINARSANEVVFVRGATEAVNLVGHGLEPQIKAGDVILLSLLEHHSNTVPWQMLAKRTGAKVVFSDVTESGELDVEDLKAKLRHHRPKLLGITSISNALGTVVPLPQVVAAAHEVGAQVLVDGAQGVLHAELDVQALDIDYLVASGHKMYGPTGIGFLYGKARLLEQLEPFQGGGGMIAQVTVDGSTWTEVPARFEAGTPAIGEAIALGTAVEFLESIRGEALHRHEAAVLQYGYELLRKEPGVAVHGPITAGKEQVSILSFSVEGVHPHDVSTILDAFNVQIRAGHHCAMPLLKRLGLSATARASVGAYSVKEDFDRLVEGVREVRKVFARR